MYTKFWLTGMHKEPGAGGSWQKKETSVSPKENPHTLFTLIELLEALGDKTRVRGLLLSPQMYKTDTQGLVLNYF